MYIIGSSRPKEEFYTLSNVGGLATQLIDLSFSSDTSMGGFTFSQTLNGDCAVQTTTDSQHLALMPLAPNQSCNIHVLFSTGTSNSYSTQLVARDETPPPPTSSPGFASLTLSVLAVFM